MGNYPAYIKLHAQCSSDHAESTAKMPLNHMQVKHKNYHTKIMGSLLPLASSLPPKYNLHLLPAMETAQGLPTLPQSQDPSADFVKIG